ncbi:hypothetical protein B0B36_30560 [Pseudomonas syringae pv. actinidifoliorum]|nr:hypothetical protein B0B36_30560 [Pseudomonas syringae pv. actinidifoliorum]
MWREAPQRGRRASRTACDAERRTIVEKPLFYRDGTDDAECDVSDRAKEPDGVGPETEPGFCLL